MIRHSRDTCAGPRALPFCSLLAGLLVATSSCVVVLCVSLGFQAYPGKIPLVKTTHIYLASYCFETFFFGFGLLRKKMCFGYIPNKNVLFRGFIDLLSHTFFFGFSIPASHILGQRSNLLINLELPNY